MPMFALLLGIQYDVTWHLSRMSIAIPKNMWMTIGNYALLLKIITPLTECPALKTIVFLDCKIGSEDVKKFGETMAKRRDPTGAWLHRVVIFSRTQFRASSICPNLKSG